MIKTLPNHNYDINYMDIHSCDHCNQACLGCNHMAPFQSKKCYNAEDYIPWFNLLKYANIRIHLLGISGGEPFLNPNITELVVN